MALFAGYSVAIGVVSIMLAVSGIILGLGIAANDRKLRDFGREELYQSVINGVIIGSLFAALAPGGLISGIVGSVVPAQPAMQCSGLLSSNYAICFANTFLVGLQPVTVGNSTYPTLMQSSLAVFVPAVAIYGGIAFLSSLNINAVVVSVSLGAVLKPAVTLLNYVISALTFTMAGLEMQSILLQFIAGTALSVLIPAGLILRAFYFTRRLGGAILALTIALFAVFPLTYVMDAQLVASYSTSNAEAMQSIAGNVTAIGANIGGAINGNVTTGIVSGIAGKVQGFFSYIETQLGMFASAVASLLVEAFLLPVFSLILTMVSARELARILGSEISFGKFDMF